MSGKLVVVLGLATLFATVIATKSMENPVESEIFIAANSDVDRNESVRVQADSEVYVAKRKLCNAHNLIFMEIVEIEIKGFIKNMVRMCGKLLVLFAIFAFFATVVSSESIENSSASEIVIPVNIDGDGTQSVIQTEDEVHVAKRKLCNAHNLICNLWR
ncbi:hypothetical protein QR680_000166 [Steinernema hermaphroditum]|uniref:Uncharacterized protein n=1 Tax=Steinernema hermaphroditum TaxID=289476 RepID=A0AA39GVN4_9BILA|nr:hypothetical protein QR680_000166 [Steinernema hermaphroditum]